MAHSTNYRNTLILVSEDSTLNHSRVPDRPGTIAALQYALLHAHPYEMTSDDLLFEVYAQRAGIAEAERDARRDAFFAKPQPCLRASPLVKSFGFGIHHNSEGRVALVPKESAQYEQLRADAGVEKRPGMRSSRARKNG